MKRADKHYMALKTNLFAKVVLIIKRCQEYGIK